MPFEHNGKTYLNTGESSKEFLGVSYLTFQAVQENYGLKAKQFVGQQKRKFFLKEALELIKNSSTDEIEEVKKKIQELQEQS